MKEYRTRVDLFKALPEHSIIAEIGVFSGAFSEEIMRACNPKSLYLVDIWTGRFGSGDKDGRHHTEIPNMLETYLGLCEKYRDRSEVKLIRSDSKTFFRCWTSAFFDAVYIDADHSYQAVYDDLVGSLAVLKPGGLLMGHDYHGQVKKAVDDFCYKMNLRVSDVAQDRCPSFLIHV